MKLVLSSVFEADLAELAGMFNESGGGQVSNRFEDEVARVTSPLLTHPELGRERKNLKPDGIRSFGLRHFRNYILFYQVKGNELIFLRIRFGGMDLTALFPAD